MPRKTWAPGKRLTSKKTWAILGSISMLLSTFPLSISNAQSESMARRISALIATDAYHHANWGIIVADQNTGESLYEFNADKLFAPASTTKLFTTAAALDALGPDFKFTTPLYRTGEISKEGKLHGDLVLKASGDPNLSGRIDSQGHLAYTNEDHIYADFGGNAVLTDTDPLSGIDDLAKLVAASGTNQVRDVLIDDRLFDHEAGSGSGPTLLTPIVVNDNLIDLTVKPREKAGYPATVAIRPQTEYAQFDIEVETVDRQGGTEVAVEQVAPRRYTVRGRIAAGRKPLVKIAVVDDPAEFARTLLIERLRAHGVVVKRSPFSPMDKESLPAPSEYSKLTVVAQHISPPFSEAIKVILKVSHNLGASLLPLIVASQKGERTIEEGLGIEGDFLRRVGVESESISFGGGAGGTRADFVTPRSVAELLLGMSKRPVFQVYHDSLPILGVDGTLSEAVDEASPVRGSVYAKTGTLVAWNAMDHSLIVTSKTLAGYMTAASGRKLVVAIYLNNQMVKSIDDVDSQGRVIGRLCELIYESL
ncbi:MAG TPA: D-alanyl-D-alanine carboxypeptidase/D-alanyl-D-alanine-endopeptidase [Blastocatellia bacterium]|nr:D-alanyl-D-alanine carboxypeptidase/D-alanyl-D-alanine-endopeptidase [Blastocatellia bacterium]